ncbi:MAG TPA: gamma-glutamylcyclotransferase family protein [Polyangiaceae bacterium]|jgi:gamma-glutamylcyclotransferase (GGCT)/AIG2-like uncharacterized protein YtfP|nr:gamma-glutamylcyclotransferase family protein [Polyangiaceae bacterium]
MSGPVVLFVYGSLLCGEPAFFRLKGARFLGRARTAPQFTLLDLGEYPALLPGGTASIAGELYEIPPETLAELDAYEGHPSLYERTEIILESGSRAEAYLLAGAAAHPEVASGDWRRTSERRAAVARIYRAREALEVYPDPEANPKKK